MRPSEAKQLHRRTDGLVIDNDAWSNEDDFVEFLKSAYNNALDNMKNGAVFYIWHASNQAHNFLRACQESGMTVRQTLIWNKNTFALGRQDYQWKHEPCLYGWKDGGAHYFIEIRNETTVFEDLPDFEHMKKSEAIDLLKEIYSDKVPTTILNEKKPAKSELHPTMKPVKLISRQIINSSRKGENVLDLFGGSGTTLMACEQLGRKAFLMEYDPHYTDVIIDRWEQYTGQKAVLING